MYLVLSFVQRKAASDLIMLMMYIAIVVVVIVIVITIDTVVTTGDELTGRYFEDDILGYIFRMKIYILIHISLKFVPKGEIDNKPALVQMMARRRAIFWTNYGIYASLGLDELTVQYFFPSQ